MMPWSWVEAVEAVRSGLILKVKPSRLTIGPAVGPEIEDSSMAPWPEQLRE